MLGWTSPAWFSRENRPSGAFCADNDLKQAGRKLSMAGRLPSLNPSGFGLSTAMLASGPFAVFRRSAAGGSPSRKGSGNFILCRHSTHCEKRFEARSQRHGIGRAHNCLDSAWISPCPIEKSTVPVQNRQAGLWEASIQFTTVNRLTFWERGV